MPRLPPPGPVFVSSPVPSSLVAPVQPQISAAVTAGQQSNAKSDVELTRQIREAVVKDASLSVMAQNVKIVSANGSVTLRGPVKSATEKDAIGSKAQAIAGADRVNNQLEVRNQ